MKKIWKKILATCCAIVMLVTLPGMYILADELPEDIFIDEICEAAEVPDDIADIGQAEAPNVSDSLPNTSDQLDYSIQFPNLDEVDDNVDIPEYYESDEHFSNYDGEIVGAVSRPASYPQITYAGQIVDSITYRGITTNAVYTPYRSGLDTDWTYGCFVLVKNFYSSVYGITVSNLVSTSAVPNASSGYFYETRSPRVGDIIRFNTLTHWALVKSISGSTITLIQMNAWWNNYTCAQVGCTVDASDTSVSFFSYSGYLPNDGNPSEPEIWGEEMSNGYEAVLPDGDYMIVNAADPSRFLDISGGDSPAANGTNVDIWGPVGNLAAWDVWNIKYSNGFYTIRQKDTDVCLDVSGGDARAGTNVQAWWNNGYSPQKWAVSKNWPGYRLQSKCSGFSLDLEGGLLEPGTNVRQWVGNDSFAQKWLFIPYEPARTIADGRYILVSALNPSLILDISGDTADVANGTNVQVWNDSALNKYNSIDVKYLEHGYYRLTHAASGKSLDVEGYHPDSGTNIQLYTWEDKINQKWAITKHGDGYVIWSRCSGLILDVKDAGTSNGTNVWQCYYNGSNAQLWKFVQAEYSVNYNANGGTGAPASQTKYYRNALTLSSTKPTRSGYTFKGWSTSNTVTSADYQPGSSYTTDKDVTLYAVWEVQKKSLSDCTISLSQTSYTYDGTVKKPSVTIKNGATTLTNNTDYTVAYLNNTNAGTATVTVTGKGNYTGTISKTFSIVKAMPILKFASSSLSKKIGDAAFTNTLTKTTDGAVTFKSSNTSVAMVNSTSGLVTVKGAGTATITATASAGTNYKAGSASYTLTVTVPAPAGFSDVQDPSHPYYKAIYWAAEAGITKGYSDGTFGIDKACTRSEAVMFLWRMAGKPAPVDALSSPFKDVPKSHAHYKAILWAAQKGITKGYRDGTFGINKTCTRGQIMTFIWRFKGQPAPKDAAKSPFSDVPKNHAYYKAILWGSQNKITNGFSDGTFGINKNCTRGQIVTFLYRAK